MMEMDIDNVFFTCFNSHTSTLDPANQTAHNFSKFSNNSFFLPDDSSESHICDSLLKKLSEGDSDEQWYTRHLITYYLMGIGGMIICSTGLIGNILSLLILTHKSMRSSTYSYLSALTVCDSFVLIFTMILLVRDVKKPTTQGKQNWLSDQGVYPHMLPYVHAAAFTSQVTSIWLTLAFTVDRYIKICYPFKAGSFCSVSKARKVIISLILCSIIFNIPKFFEYKTVAIILPLNVTQITFDLTDLGRSHMFRVLYHSWLYVVFVCGVPFIALAVLNSFLMHVVRLSRRKGREMNAAEKKRNDTTVMLISVVVTFFICQIPGLASRMMWALEDGPGSFKALPLYTLNEIASFLIVLNSAINIVPYCFFGTRFRKELYKLICPCLIKYHYRQELTQTISLTRTCYDNRNNSIVQSEKQNTLL